MKPQSCGVWQVINTHKSLSSSYAVPRVKLPFACLEINLRAKWTGRWQGDEAAWTFITELNGVHGRDGEWLYKPNSNLRIITTAVFKSQLFSLCIWSLLQYALHKPLREQFFVFSQKLQTEAIFGIQISWTVFVILALIESQIVPSVFRSFFQNN